MSSDYLFINASSRKKGTSAMFCHRLQKRLGGEIIELFSTDLSVILDIIEQSKVIVISGPCYVNSYPARVTLILEELQKRPDKCHGQKMYGIINGGMPYVHTHESGLHQLEIFCDECNMHYSGGFVIGGGPMLNGQNLEQHMFAKNIVPAFEVFTEHIKREEDSPKLLYERATVKMPKLLAILMTKWMNNTVMRQLRTHGFDYHTPSPYRD